MDLEHVIKTSEALAARGLYRRALYQLSTLHGLTEEQADRVRGLHDRTYAEYRATRAAPGIPAALLVLKKYQRHALG
ncbi:TPA: hypothetical protein ACNADN_005229 [Klebsiella pneumoniae]